MRQQLQIYIKRINLMSNYSILDKKHRLSTITTQAGLSNGRRLKTTVGAQFNTINVISQKKTQPKQHIAIKKHQNSQHIQNITGSEIKKQSRRYSEANQSMRTQHQSLNLKQKPNNLSAQKSYKISVNNRQSEEQMYNNKVNKIRMKSQYNINQNKIVVPYFRLPEQEVVVRQEDFVNSNQYLQQLQKEKNRRIQQIYNPQSIGSSKIAQGASNKSISVLRKHKSKGISANKFGSEQLIQSLKHGRHGQISRQHDKSSISANSRENSVSREERDHNFRKQNANRINILVSSNHNQYHHQKIGTDHNPQNSYSGPRILPVTFQRIQQLSTIKQSAEGSNKAEKIRLGTNKQKVVQYGNLINYEKSDRDPATDALSVSSKPRTSTPQSGLPFPKFNNFLQNYQKNTRNKSETKTYLFKQMKKTIQVKNTQQVLQNSTNVNSDVKKQTIKQLTIFNQLDKSMLKAIKSHDGVYYGQVGQNGCKSGKGAIFYHTGKIYQGEFKNDVKDGQGQEQHPDGSFYIGHFASGKRNGKGRFQWPNGQVYDGQWENNLKHGSGLWQSRDSLASYIGQWNHGSISGFGVLTNQKGQRYEGEFQNFNKQGHGAFRFENGDRLVGNFKRNQPNGQCQYFWANGDYYKGDFSNGLRHGKGVIKYTDSSYFQGQFRNDKKCGLGREHYSDGIIYYGNYENDLRHGYGKLIYNEEIYYEGYWINNVAVIFKDNSVAGQEIIEDEKQRLASGFSNNLSSKKLKKLNEKQQEKILKSMRSKAALKKSKIQKFSSKNLLERLCEPKRRCKCLLKH